MKSKTRMMSILAIALVLVVALSAVFVGCGKTEKVKITGSTSVAPLMKVLAAAYEKENKNVRIEVGEGGSSQGIKDTQDGKNDIGMASRDLKKRLRNGRVHRNGAGQNPNSLRWRGGNHQQRGFNRRQQRNQRAALRAVCLRHSDRRNLTSRQPRGRQRNTRGF